MSTLWKKKVVVFFVVGLWFLFVGGFVVFGFLSGFLFWVGGEDGVSGWVRGV